VRDVSEEQPDTKELRLAQSRREAEERALARAAPDEEETATHQRRADKAHYLQQKLEERAESEREATRPGASADDEASRSQRDE
jgi:beta-lactamase class A